MRVEDTRLLGVGRLALEGRGNGFHVAAGIGAELGSPHTESTDTEADGGSEPFGNREFHCGGHSCICAKSGSGVEENVHTGGEFDVDIVVCPFVENVSFAVPLLEGSVSPGKFRIDVLPYAGPDIVGCAEGYGWSDGIVLVGHREGTLAEVKCPEVKVDAYPFRYPEVIDYTYAAEEVETA